MLNSTQLANPPAGPTSVQRSSSDDLIQNVDQVIILMAQVDGANSVKTSVCNQDESSSTSHREYSVHYRARLLNLPARTYLPESVVTFIARQQWEGYVREINNDDFVADLVDLTGGDTCIGEEAVIPMAEISDEDVSKMRLGSIFRWVIGYERTPAGTKRRVSHIVFRDLPTITKEDWKDGKTWAHEAVQAMKL